MTTTFIKRLILCFLVVVVSLLPTYSFSQITAVKKVVLDAGHGGKDPGNLGTGRYKKTEKEIVLEVTLKVGEYISTNFPDVEVIYTRTGDTYPTLRERTDLANREKADLFISIHCDAFTTKSAHGTSSHVMGLRYTEENLRIAQKENSVIYLEDNYEENYDGFDPKSPEGIIVLTLSQSTFLEQSILIAQKIQEQFKIRVNRRDRGVKQTPLWVTSRTSMPSVLVELGFLTNASEEDFLHSEEGQVYMASAIYRAFKEYKLELEKNANISVLQGIAEEVEPEVSKEILTKEKASILSDKNINKGLIFKVQIASSVTAEKKEDLAGHSIEYFQEGNLYKYTIGSENSLEEAKKIQIIARENGYRDAFVIAYWNGEKMPIAKALEKKKTHNNE